MGHPGVGENPHFSQRTREMGHPGCWRKSPLLAKDARNGAPGVGENPHFSQRTREMGHPGVGENPSRKEREKWGTRVSAKIPTSRKEREKWGTRGVGENPHFSQKTREMGHPAKIPTSRKRREKWGTRRKSPLLAKDARNGAPGVDFYPNSSSRLARNWRSGSCWVRASAFSYDARASAVRPSLRHISARAECAR